MNFLSSSIGLLLKGVLLILLLPLIVGVIFGG